MPQPITTMDEESSDRAVEQAILAIKKGAYLLKCGGRGKPKLCPFRLSMNERHLIWYSGQKEKQLRLSSVINIIRGQRTVNLRWHLQLDRECRSFSLIYTNGEHSLDLICKDKGQADSWFVGLKTVISSLRGAQSCTSSPAGYTRRKHNLGLLEDVTGYSQVHKLCGSPTQSLSERFFTDGLSYSSESFYRSDSGLSHLQNVMMDIIVPSSPCIKPKNQKKRGSSFGSSDLQNNTPSQFLALGFGSQQLNRNEVLKDVMIWGEGIAAGVLGGGIDDIKQSDALLPKLLESTAMLDVHSMCLGKKHAGLVTKKGEVFCWGEGNGGRLGHKVNLDLSEPKLVDSLNGVHVKSIACSEYQTCALTLSGEVYTWGDNGYSTTRNQWWPQKLSGPLHGVSISSVACGEWHIAMVSTSGQLFTYGDGIFGVLGHGNLQSISQPKEVESLKGLVVKSVACGSWHTAAIVDIMVDCRRYKNAMGKLFTWGDGDKGRLGHAGTGKKLLPTCVAQLVDHDFVQVSCGRTLTVGLSSRGVVYTMGSGVNGPKDKLVTTVEGKLKEEFVKEIASGSYHIAVLTSSGSVYTWGKGLNGQLGLGDFEDRNLPTLVEALRDRQVEGIACGSNITAAICVHKDISDRSSCKECKLLFGLARKKHNCYNCGLLFCRACCSKKVREASLAPNKSKPSRVCNPCFSHLQRLTDPGRLWKLENQSPRPLLITHKPSSDDCGEESSKLRNRGQEQHHMESASSLSVGMQRWGQVRCPSQFETGLSRNNMALVPFFHNQVIPQLPEPSVLSAMIAEPDKMLAAEVQRLRAEVRVLEKRCQIGSKRLQECQEMVEEAWAVAKDEAAKCKAAKEIIKAFALQLHTMSDKASIGRLPRDVVDANMAQVTPIRTRSSAGEGFPQGYAAGTPSLSEGMLRQDN